MGGQSSSSTPQGRLSNLFANNQSGQVGQSNTLPAITAPQSLIGQMDFSSIPTMQPQPVPPTYAAPAQSQANNFRPDKNNPGYGWMSVSTGDNSEGGQNAFRNYYVSAPAPQAPPPAPAPYQPSRSAQIAALINSQFGKK